TASIRLGAIAPDLKLRGFGSPTHLVVDVVGYWMDEELNGAVGGLFHPMVPCRTVDTRQATGGALRERSSRQLSLVGRDLGAQGGSGAGCAIPAESLAVEAAVSAVAPRGDGFLRAWPAYAGEPTATIVNFRDGESATNTGALPREVGLGRDVVARAYGATTDLVLDATGYFLPPGQTVLVTSDRSDDVRLRPTADGRMLFFDGDPRGPEPGVHRWQEGAGSQLVLDQEVWHPVPSADGSVVAVNAKGSDLDPPMEGEGADLWTFDPADGLLDREVTLPDFEWSGVVALSGDASTLVFQTEASDLVAGDDEASRDLFLLDRSDGTISSPTLDADLDLSWANTISHDGTVVAFTAKASGQEWAAAYVWSASTGLSTRISPEGVDARFADVSADGTTVVYAGASNGSTATIRSYGIATGLTTEISDAATSSFQPTVSGDGRYIAYVQNSEVVETRPGTSQPWWYWSATRVIRVFDVATGATVTAVAGDFDSVSPAIASAGDHIFVQQGPPEGPGPVGIYRWQRPST
ncbi:MAG: hypothetical protein KDA98_16170, partial [Acidimicrobiales bacterium]|nr:hypothetical protein [Acidimicrobiales bacterium]